VTPEKRAQELIDCGYTEVQERGRLRVGARVRHVGQQYPQARNGTATIERIFTRGVDVELIAKRDKPDWGPNDTHGYWADYHTVVI
jgi:hypothetical protein